MLAAADTLAFVGRLPLAEGDFQAWVLNAETLGVTRYENFPFNSLVEHDGRTWGVTETGLYELTGDDDAGEPIAAWLRTGMLDFGTGAQMTCPRAYLYMQSDRSAILRTLVDQAGRRRHVDYTVAFRPGDALRARTVELGRGVRFVSVAFELANTGGADIDIRGLEAMPVILRRVR
jgi:hypothetical protein